MQLERNRSSTRKNYYCVWKMFNQFFIKLDQKPSSWEDRLTLFVGYIVNKGLKSTTVRSYISAIRAVLMEDGILLNEDKYLLSSLTKACRYKNNRVLTRFPIQKSLLSILVQQFSEYYDSQTYLLHMYTALFVTTYYGLLQVGEVTTGTHPIKAVDVHLAENKRKFMLVLHLSTTHWLDEKPQFIKLTSTASHNANNKKCRPGFTKLCPYTILWHYLTIRPVCTSLAEPFFIFHDKSPVQPHHMRKILKLMLTLAGFSPSYYGCHSFCIGHCVDLYKLGIEISFLKKIGRQKSNCVYTYLSTASNDYL